MMGMKERHFAPLINVSLEELVPQDHFYRQLERTLDLSFVREFVQETYAGKGRPSIDPVVFFKLQLVMFFDGTKVQANASTESVKPRFFVEAHLAHLFGAQTEELREETDEPMPQTEGVGSRPVEQEATPLPTHLPISLSQELDEELTEQNSQRHEWIEQLGAQDRSVSSKWYQRVADLRVSTTDPDASL